MKKNTFPFVLFAFFLLFSATILMSCKDKATAKEAITTLPQNFNDDVKVVNANLNSLYEYYIFDIESFKVMNERSANVHLQAFSKQEVEMSKRLMKEIRNYAQQYNLVLDTVYSENLKNSLYKLTTADKKDFDRIFTQDYLEINERFNDSLQKRIDNTNTADLKELLQKVYNENSNRLMEMLRIKDSIR